LQVSRKFALSISLVIAVIVGILFLNKLLTLPK
jgi:hypothetical protein